MAVTISNLSTEDRKDWETLYHGYAEFYKVPITDKTLDTIWHWIFDENEAFFCIIAKDASGKGVGLMHYREMASPLRGTKAGFLDDLFVDPACRGTGVVDALFKELSRISRSKNWPFVRWLTADNNYRGRGAYDKLAERTMWLTYQMNL